MSLLVPLYAAGALAVALPILFHLIRRTPRGRMPFSTLMFLKPSPPRLTRRSRLEHLILLLLRALALILLAMAFTRPFLWKQSALDLDDVLGRRIIVLIDTSASMRRGDLWQQAVDKAKEAIGETRPEDKVALYAFDDQARSVIDFDDWTTPEPSARVALAEQRLEILEPTWYATRLGGALIVAADDLVNAEDRESLEHNPRPMQIVLISDMQEGSRLDDLHAYEWREQVLVKIQTLRAQEPTNAGLQLLVDAQDTVRGDEADRPRIRIINAPDSDWDQFQYRWDTGEPSAGLLAYVPAGESRVLRATAAPPGTSGAKLILENDAQGNDFDNAVYVIPPLVQDVSVLYLGEDDAQDVEGMLYYLGKAFPDTRWRKVNLEAYTPADDVWVDDVDKFQLAVVTASLPESATKALQTMLERGRTVLVVMKSGRDVFNVASLHGDVPDGLEGSEAVVTDYAMLGEIDYTHPVFAPFSAPGFGDFTTILFLRHRRVGGIEGIPGAKVIARFDDSDPALIHLPVGPGSIFLLTSGWHPQDSGLARSTKFVPLINEILDFGQRRIQRADQYFVGDPVPLPEPMSVAGSTRTVTKPDGEESVLTDQASVFTETDLPGIYTLTEGTSVQRFAVNLDPFESKTAVLEFEDLENFGIGLTEQVIEPEEVTQEKRSRMLAIELEGKQKLWRWFIAAALAVLILETWLAGRLSLSAKRQEGVQE